MTNLFLPVKGRDLVAYTDGSYGGGLGIYAATVRLADDPSMLCARIYGECTLFSQMANMSAELEAFYRAVEFAYVNGASSVKVYTDSEIISLIVNGRARARHQEMVKFVCLMSAIKMLVSVEHVRGHSGDMFNMEVDMLARRELRTRLNLKLKEGVV